MTTGERQNASDNEGGDFIQPVAIGRTRIQDIFKEEG